LCDSDKKDPQKRVTTATDPLLRNAGISDEQSTIAPRQVTFEPSTASPTKGILKGITSGDSSINEGGNVEQMPVLPDLQASRREEAKTPPRSPGSEGSFGSNHSSPGYGQASTGDFSDWGVVKGTSSPLKNGDGV